MLHERTIYYCIGGMSMYQASQAIDELMAEAFKDADVRGQFLAKVRANMDKALTAVVEKNLEQRVEYVLRNDADGLRKAIMDTYAELAKDAAFQERLRALVMQKVEEVLLDSAAISAIVERSITHEQRFVLNDLAKKAVVRAARNEQRRTKKQNGAPR